RPPRHHRDGTGDDLHHRTDDHPGHRRLQPVGGRVDRCDPGPQVDRPVRTHPGHHRRRGGAPHPPVDSFARVDMLLGPRLGARIEGETGKHGEEAPASGSIPTRSGGEEGRSTRATYRTVVGGTASSTTGPNTVRGAPTSNGWAPTPTRPPPLGR